MKITVFGDSITKGLSLENGMIKRIGQSAITTISERLHLSINNISMFGQSLKRFKEKDYLNDFLSNLDSQEHNVCVMCLGGNDSDYVWGEVEQTPNEEHGSFTNPDDFYQMLTDIIKTLKKNNVDVLLTSLFPIDSKRYFDNTICKKHNGDPIIAFLHNDVNNLYRHHEQFNNLITRCAHEEKCDFIDYRTPLLQRTDFLDYLSLDGIHPNQKGHDYIADKVCDYCLTHYKDLLA